MNRTAITRKIDGLEIVTGFGELSIDPMATKPIVAVEIQNTDEFKAVKVVQDKRNASIGMAGGSAKLSKKAKNKDDKEKHWNDHLNYLEQAKGHENEVKGLLPALKAKERELRQSEAVYFEPKAGEHIVSQMVVSELSEKINDGNLVNMAGEIIPDNRGAVYCKKVSGKWRITEINTLGVAIPKSVILYADLDETQKSEVALQIEINRVAGLSAAEKLAGKSVAIDAAAQQAVSLRSQYEIQGTADPLAEATAWYNSRLAELDLIYG